VAAALAVTIRKNISDGSLRKTLGTVVVTGATEDTPEEVTLNTGLRQVEHITFATRYSATPVTPTLQDDTVLPITGKTVTLSISNNGTFYFEAVGYGM
jgi:hypothetical protein